MKSSNFRSLVGTVLLISGCQTRATDEDHSEAGVDAGSGAASCEIVDGCGVMLDCGCNAVELCEPVLIAGDCVVGVPGIVGPWACVLDALAVGAPGALTIEATDEGCGYIDFIYLLGDGTAVTARRSGDAGVSRRVELRAPGHFEVCKEAGDSATVNACLLDWYSAEICAPADCCQMGLVDAGEGPKSCE